MIIRDTRGVTLIELLVTGMLLAIALTGLAASFPLAMQAVEIQTQGSATYNYNPWYGNNTPPAGFPLGSGNEVVIIRKSFLVCADFNDDTGGPTPCN